MAIRAKLERIPHRYIVGAFALVITGIVLVTSLARSSDDSKTADRPLVFFTVQPRDLPIIVTERGVLESQKNVQVVCEVDDIPSDAIEGTAILWIIENGSMVKKGDLVVELETTSHVERLDEELLETIRAREQFTARSLDYEKQMTANETSKANAILALEIAKLRLKQFEDEFGGTFQLDLQKVDLEIRRREEEVRINNKNFLGVQHLCALGYKSSADLAQASLEALKSTSALTSHMAQRRKLVENTYVRTRTELEGGVKTAVRNVKQVDINNAAGLLQNQIWRQMAKLGKVWHEQRLEQYRDQLKKCKLYAPQDGMVAYYVNSNGWGRSSTISEGSGVRNGQIIMSIPDLTRMQAKTVVHETAIDHVRTGMRAKVHLENYSHREFDATVKSIDVLPDPGNWLGSDIKVFNTIVSIDQKVDGIKPGLTAVVEITVDQLTDVLCVPIQAIVHRGLETWCYVSKNDQVVKCPVEVGRSNDAYVEICKGLSTGDRVVTDPSPILDKDLKQSHEIAPDKKKIDAFQLH